MGSRTKLSDIATLELYRVALENAENQPDIAGIMASLGYSTEEFARGKTLLSQARNAFNLNKIEDDETSEAYATFAAKRAALNQLFSLHRKKAKVIFRNDSLTSEKLAITGSIPHAYIKFVEAARKFYSEVSTSTEIQNKLSRLQITPEQLTEAVTLISELETARAVYLKEKGESQEATKSKDAAIAAIDDWMSEFYAVAKIGLEDSPQLMEALGKTVKG